MRRGECPAPVSTSRSPLTRPQPAPAPGQRGIADLELGREQSDATLDVVSAEAASAGELTVQPSVRAVRTDARRGPNSTAESATPTPLGVTSSFG